jgi:hypothetical protein
MPAAPTPFALASSAKLLFQASKPAAELPHCAAFAFAPGQTSSANTATAAIENLLPFVIQNSLRAVGSKLAPDHAWWENNIRLRSRELGGTSRYIALHPIRETLTARQQAGLPIQGPFRNKPLPRNDAINFRE